MPKPIPDEFRGATPMLAFRGAQQAIEFYQRAFGAVELFRLTDPQGTIVHAELKIGEAVVMLAEEDPRYNRAPQTLGGTSVILNLYVTDVDAFVQRATAAGAQVVIPVADQFYGDRSGRIIDPFGYVWIISTHKEDVSSAEMQKRLNALYGMK